MRVMLKEEGLLEGDDHYSMRLELLRALKGNITIDFDWKIAEREELQSESETVVLHGK